MQAGRVFLLLSLVLGTAVASWAGYEQPVRPGGVGGQAFWNENAVQFVFAPAFGFDHVDGAKSYRFTVADAKGGTHVFVGAEPTAPLTPVWAEIPENCRVELTVEALDAQGKVLSVAGRRSFWRMAEFHENAHPPAKRSYAEAARRAYDYIFGLPSTQYFLKNGKPDPAYGLNAYPAKMHAALVQAMVRYARIRPDRREDALKLARAAADYLISVSQPEGSPLAGFPPTYDNPKLGPGLGGVGPASQGKSMLLYPAAAGRAYLALYRMTVDPKYREAAERIGRKYLELQGEDGTWTLKVDEKTGEPVNANRAFPLGICGFLEDLSSVVNDARYGGAIRRGLDFVRCRPMRDWNWEGQFEDVEPSAKYRNLTKHSVCDMAIFLLKTAAQDPETRTFARQAADFSEDQFVCWRTPCDERGEGPRPGDTWATKYTGWHCPGVLEQYECYVPIDSSATKLIRMWRTIGRVSGDPLDLAKARAMADAVVNMQQENGRIPTFWTDELIADPRSDWLNCMIATAGELDDMAKMEGDRHAKDRPVLIVNGDNDHYFKAGQLSRELPIAERFSVRGLERYVDIMTRGGKVTHLFMCAVGQRADYDSKVCDPIWMAIDEAKARGLEPNEWPVNAKKLHDLGIDPFKVWCDYCRRTGKASPWISQRMNDVHHVSADWNMRTNRFWWEHPEFWRKPNADRKFVGSWTDVALDYSHHEVREFEFAIFKELVDRYDADGFELDFMRFWEHLTPGREREQAPILTDFIRRCRRYADEVGARRGRRIGLATRCPTSYAAAWDFGFDPETWAREGLIDILAVANFWAADDYDFDFANWKSRISAANPKVIVVPSVGDNISCGSDVVPTSSAALKGWADNVRADGAEGLYVFNAAYLCREALDLVLDDGLSGPECAKGPRRYICSFHDCVKTPEQAERQLPRKLDGGAELTIRVGRPSGDAASVVLGFDQDCPAPGLRINGLSAGAGEQLKTLTPYGKTVKCAWRFELQPEAIRGGRNRLSVSSIPGVSVVWAEIVD